MFLRAVKSIFTEYARIRTSIFDESINRGSGKDIDHDWTAFVQGSDNVRTRGIASTPNVWDRHAGVESRAISNLGFDGVMPKTERRGNPKRKPNIKNPYGSYKKEEGR